MTTATLERELLGLEKQFWDAIMQKDGATVARLTDEPCIVTGASGVARLDRATLAAMLTDASYELTSYAFDPSSVQVLAAGNDVAVVAYKVTEQLVVEGEPLTLEAFDASTWTRRDGGWVCTLHTESIAGDGFGRDRK